jgi:hypothetical protein
LQEPVAGRAVGTGIAVSCRSGPASIVPGDTAARRAARDPTEDAVPRLPIGLAVLAFAVDLSPGIAAAQPPDGADPSLRPWFESLKQPGTGVSCCSIADCRPVQYRLAPDGYEALIDMGWVHVPEDRVLHNKQNPLGRAVLCRSPASGAIFCFVPGPEPEPARAASLDAPAAPHCRRTPSTAGRAGSCRTFAGSTLPRGRGRG